VGLIARALEARGLPTLSTSCLWETSAAIKPPRTVCCDFPLGCPAGRPNDLAFQREVLRAVFAAAPTFGEPWRLVELLLLWSEDGSRAWEEDVKTVYRKNWQIVRAHGAEHRRMGETLDGREREFAIRCNC